MRNITIVDICRDTGAHRTTIFRRAAALGLGEKVGVQILFTADEAAQIAAAVRPGQPGNPRIAEHSADALKTRWNLEK
jgi:hypothetical protein